MTQPEDDEVRRQLGRRLREAREYLGISQEDVAAVLGIARPGVTHIEAGSRRVEALELQKLSELYGRSVQFFLNGASSEDTPRLAFLARATKGLTERDLDELGRFAEFLRTSGTSARKGPR